MDIDNSKIIMCMQRYKQLDVISITTVNGMQIIRFNTFDMENLDYNNISIRSIRTLKNT